MRVFNTGWLVAVVVSTAVVGLQPVARSAVPVTRDPQRFIQKEMTSWKALREQNIVMQKYDYSCGAASLATVCRYFWNDNVTEKDFLEAVLQTLSAEELKDRMENGLSLTDLRKAAVKKGYVASSGKRSLQQLRQAKVPVIVRISKNDYDHFVVFRGIIEDRVFLADPVRGNIRVSIPVFLSEWNNGNATDGVIFVVAKPYTKPPESSPLLVRDCLPTRLRHELQAPQRSLFLLRPQNNFLRK
jgi:predicted double-glycine peptidase